MNSTIISSFDSNYHNFDSSIARELAALIQKAYDQYNNPVGWSLNQPYQLQGKFLGDQINFAWLDRENVPFGFIASNENSKKIYVVFRGTRSFIEWFKDAQIKPQSYNEVINSSDTWGDVAQGFKDIYLELQSELIKTLKKCSPDSQVFVTGHSLGGALATLAIPDIIHNTQFKPQNVIAYTFASPRCGNKTFANKFLETGVRHWRIANTEDIVTMLPFPTGNVTQPANILAKPEPEVTNGAENTDVIDGEIKDNPNPLFEFLQNFWDKRRHRMPNYAHTGTPVYFTIHEGALERHHNLDEVYMRGINQLPIQ